MSAIAVNLSITQGDTFSIRLEIRDSEGEADDLTLYGIRGSVKNKYSDTTALLDLSPTIFNATLGQVDIDVPSTLTENLPITEAVYDVEKYLLTDNSIVFKIIKGKMSISPEVTTG
jgi:hypothetical protein